VFLNLDILGESMGYPYKQGMYLDWHAAKAEENAPKHGIDFATAVCVFLDPHRMEREDT
jgi:hypothetical protein